MLISGRRREILAVGAALLALGGCAAREQAPAPQPVEVVVARASSGPVAISDELPGRVVAYRTAEIRPQVGGIVQRRMFEQGGQVRAGQPLFQINPAPFHAEASNAAATLQRAEASYSRAQVQAERLRPLVEADAVSRQSYDDAVVARDQAVADVAQARATLARRRLDLGFARVTSPISGVIGQTLVTEGALVSASDPNAMATVQQIDRVYVDVRQPVARLEALREAVASGTADPNAPVDILSANGALHPMKGRMLFSGITVDAGTGDAVVRVLVANPGRRLLPGMFVRARLPRTFQARAITVPQQAVRRVGGKPQVHVVDSKGRVHARQVVVGDVVDGRYIVLGGLRGGESVIVEGQDRVLPNTPVKPIAWRAARGQPR